MPDLTSVYNAFDADEPLPANDEVRYVDLSSVRGGSNVARKLVQRILNVSHITDSSSHLLMGHTKCGKTTELLRTAAMLEEQGFATVFFDIAEVASRTFEYTTLLLIMAAQVTDQLASRHPEAINVRGKSTEQLLNFLREREITDGREVSADIAGTAEGKTSLLTNLLGQLGLTIELRGGFQRSREVTTKLEADTRQFLLTVKEIIKEACTKVINYGNKGLVVICDGCDKLALTASDANGISHDLQRSLFVDHAADLCDIPCHVIYTVPISIPINLGDIWEQQVIFLPAVPVTHLPDADESIALKGRALLTEVISRRLIQQDATIGEIFDTPELLEKLIDISGGHISDLILLVREAVLEAQTDDASIVSELYIQRSILGRALEYTRLIEPRLAATLMAIDQYKTPPSNSDEYREIMFKRLALEYVCNDRIYVALHPLIGASEAFRQLKSPKLS